jgi:hypothetical protein
MIRLVLDIEPYNDEGEWVVDSLIFDDEEAALRSTFRYWLERDALIGDLVSFQMLKEGTR